MDQVKHIPLRSEEQSLYIIPVLEDNYVYVLAWESSALVVDPGEGKKVLSFLEKENLKLTNILCTHYHQDHTAGNEYLKRKTHCHVIGPEDDRIPGLEQSVADGEELLFGPFTIEVLSTPGHTRPHIVFFFQNTKLLFCGDLLFGGGCGRLFEGTPDEMWESLQKITTLPDETQIFFGHEYTLSNLEFAHHIEPNNAAVQKRLEEVTKMKDEGKFTTPTTLKTEKETNPYLRCDTQEVKDAVAMSTASPVEVFTHLRSLKDQWTD